MLPKSVPVRTHVFIGLSLLSLGSILLVSLYLVPRFVPALIGIAFNDLFRVMIHSMELEKFSEIRSGLQFLEVWGFWFGGVGLGVYLGIKRQWLLLATSVLVALSGLIAPNTLTIFLFATFLIYHFTRKFWVSYGFFFISLLLFLASALFQLSNGMPLTSVIWDFILSTGWILTVTGIYKITWLIRIKKLPAI